MKAFSIGEMDMGGSSDVKTMSFDIDKKEVKKLKIGQKVEIKVVGIVGKLHIDPEGRGSPSLGLRVQEQSIDIIGTNQEEGIKSLSRDEDEDEEIQEAAL